MFTFTSTKSNLPWMQKISEMYATSPTYSKDPMLFVLDVVCNIIVSHHPSNRKAIIQLCEQSYLNMSYDSLANALLAKHNESIIAFQEFPPLESAKGVHFVNHLQREGYDTFYENGNAFAVRRSHITVEPTSLSLETLTAIMEESLTHYNVSDVKLRKGFLETTVQRTQILLIGKVLCVNIHAKNPKEYAVCLAEYIRRICECAPVKGDYIVFSDTNIEKQSQLHTFEQHLQHHYVYKTGNEMTTSKHRSLIHGQTYDTNKCLRTVVASKDHICSSSPVESYMVHPPLTPQHTLPTAEHPSDHSSVVATVRISGERRLTVSTRNVCGGGENPIEFKELDNPQFMEKCTRLENTAQTLTKADVAPYFMQILQSKHIGADQSSFMNAILCDAADNVWSWFTEDALKNDNKLHDQRLNLITKAFQMHNGKYVWQIFV